MANKWYRSEDNDKVPLMPNTLEGRRDNLQHPRTIEAIKHIKKLLAIAGHFRGELSNKFKRDVLKAQAWLDSNKE